MEERTNGIMEEKMFRKEGHKRTGPKIGPRDACAIRGEHQQGHRSHCKPARDSEARSKQKSRQHQSPLRENSDGEGISIQ